MYKIINKMDKKNLALIVFLLLIFVVMSLYQTLSMYTVSSGMSIIDGVNTYKFILGGKNDDNTVFISAGSSKYLALTVRNQEAMPLNYSIYYSSTFDLTNVNIGYLKTSEYKGSGTIPGEEDYIITLKVTNRSSDDIEIKLGISYGLEKSGTVDIPNNSLLLEEEQFFEFKISEAEIGSYIKYEGTNGCVGENCQGRNANYDSENLLGYCSDPRYKFNNDGYRIAYNINNVPYIISAGVVECLPKIDKEKYNEISDQIALKYCNKNFSYDGKCDGNTAYSFSEDDFIYINKELMVTDCDKISNDKCGLNNDLLDIGGYYWINNAYNKEIFSAYFWNPIDKYVEKNYEIHEYGIRPIIKINPNVIIISGDGSKDNPYILKK